MLSLAPAASQSAQITDGPKCYIKKRADNGRVTDAADNGDARKEGGARKRKRERESESGAALKTNVMTQNVISRTRECYIEDPECYIE